MAKQVPDFKTVFKDILLHKSDFKAEFKDNLLESSEPKKDVTKLDFKTFCKDNTSASNLNPKEEDKDVEQQVRDSANIFWANGRMLHYPVLSLTIKTDKCPACGKFADHEKYTCLQDPPSVQLAKLVQQTVEEPEKEDSESEEFDTEEEKEAIKRLHRILDLSGTFVRNTNYSIGNRAYERPALRQYYETCHARDRTNVVDNAQLFDEHHRIGKDVVSGSQGSFNKEKSLGHSDVNLSHVSSNAAEKAAEAEWGKEFGFTKGPMVVQFDHNAQFSEESWDNDFYYNVHGVKPEHHTLRKCKKNKHSKSFHLFSS